MIASYSRNFIFLKTHKTAGTSLEMALTPFCGRDDIVTPIGYDDERARMVDGVVQARNYAAPEIEQAFAQAATAGDEATVSAMLDKIGQLTRFYNHMPAAQVRARLPAEFWERAFKFSVERHPYEKAVSWAYFVLGRDRAPKFEIPRYLSGSLHRVDDSPIYTIGERLVADRVLRYESLESDLAEVTDLLGLPRLELPRAKGQFRTDRRNAREILTPADRQFVASAAKRTFELFGYLP